MRFAIIFLIIPVQAALWTIQFLNFRSLTSSLPAIVLACEHFLSLPLFFDNKRTSYGKGFLKMDFGQQNKIERIFWKSTNVISLLIVLCRIARYFESGRKIFRNKNWSNANALSSLICYILQYIFHKQN